MTAADLHALAGAYALHALPADELDEFEQHLLECDACREEVASFEATAVLLADLAADTPPPDLRDDVLSAITGIRQDPPMVAAQPLPAAPDVRGDESSSAPADEATGGGEAATTPVAVKASRTTSWASRLGLGVAAGLLVVAGALGVWATSLNGQLQQRDDQARQVAAVMSAEDSHSIHQGGATLVVSPSHSQAVLAASGLSAPSSDEVLQLWVIGQDGPVSAGLMEDPTAPMLLEVPVHSGEQVGVTVEPAGGSDQPTSDPVIAFEV